MAERGVTPPISMVPPTSEELRLNDALISELRLNNSFEAPEATEARSRVVAHLQKVAEEFVRQVGRQKRLASPVIDTAGGRILTFGSYRLGVYGPGSDIDVVVVAPKHVGREDFFEHFPPALKKMSPADAIEKIHPIPDAYVPIIKLEYSGFSIDLIFTQLSISSVPESLDIRDKSLLRGMGDKDIHILTDALVADEILTLVPLHRPFRLALRAIRLWAQRRAIYDKAVGFLGGVGWAILVARICQLYPMACGATIVTKFFLIMKDWSWPRSVLLKKIEDGPLMVRVWNPTIYPADRRHLMPIITPVYPATCVTHSITHSTKAVIQRELKRGAMIANDIGAGKQSWQSLFEKHAFFTQDFNYYLSVIVASRTLDAQRMWSGRIRPNVRWLISGIETSDTGVDLARPYTKGFHHVHLCKNEEEVDQVFQGDLQFQSSEEKDAEFDATKERSGLADVTSDEDKPRIIIYTTTYYIGLSLDSADGRKRIDISNPVADFQRKSTGWMNYSPILNSLRIIHTRSYDLPPDVFEPGEERPVKRRAKIASKKPNLDQTSKARVKRTVDGESLSSILQEALKIQ